MNYLPPYTVFDECSHIKPRDWYPPPKRKPSGKNRDKVKAARKQNRRKKK